MFEPTRFLITVLLLGMALLMPSIARAEPCGPEIDRLQAEVDARIDTTAGTGRMGDESSAATEHHQPTPGSIARAEGRLGEGSDYTQILAALAQAREADQAGNAASCEQALAAARAALGR
ncbi:hypothetical protein MHY87_14825 [Microvirga sp. ACRRW]|uniref:hypothetical protein n=1 Tax=Microvirga sp. ACRRW TaxID=2918205 RepID=UPI001EF4D10B|nr:hypothetical protein [Microvirga sp. ACRRW]MCG7394179.1 hypothetical protein [Microvirga sp. ACRRW]